MAQRINNYEHIRPYVRSVLHDLLGGLELFGRRETGRDVVEPVD